MEPQQKFNIRVYGLLRWESKVLLSDEYLWGKGYTKFPGGGLEWGEGVLDCLRREMKEEIGIETSNETLFYLTDFFQPSAFHRDHQVISIYYFADYNKPELIPVSSVRFNFAKQEHGQQVFRWENINDLNPADFHFPIDQIVVKKLIAGQLT